MTFQPPREEMGNEDQKTTYLFCGGRQFKYPVVGLEHLWGGIIVWWAFSRMESGLRQVQGRGLGIELPYKHSRLFIHVDARG